MNRPPQAGRPTGSPLQHEVFLSHSLSEATPGYGGGNGFHSASDKSQTAGDSCNMQKWNLSNHIGSHVDAPRHFFETGPAVDHYPADWWVFHHVAVCAVPVGEQGRWIEPDDVAGLIGMEDEAALIVTGFEGLRGATAYWENNPGLSPELGIWLRRNRPALRLIGVDFISISRFADREKGREAHRAFLNPSGEGHPILPVEDMRLSPLENGRRKIERMVVSPLCVAGADGAPVTVIATLV